MKTNYDLCQLNSWWTKENIVLYASKYTHLSECRYVKGNGHGMIDLSPPLSPCKHGKRKLDSGVAAMKLIF
jgi:hypothetical protein